MKHLLFAIGLVATLAGCSKKEEPAPEPMPTPVGGTWSQTNITTISTPSDGGAPTTYSFSPLANSYTLVFTEDGRVTYTISPSASPTGSYYIQVGTFTLDKGVVTLTFPGSYIGAPSFTETSTTFTDHQLVLTGTLQSAQATSVSTITYSR